MLKNYFKVAFRNLSKHKTFSVINILGLTFSISVCLVILLFILKEYGFDDYNKNANQIYKLVDTKDNSSSIDYRVAGIIRNNYAEVKNTCYLQIMKLKVGTYYSNNALFIDNIMSTDENFFKMFTVPFIYGNPAKPFENINSAILTESTARNLFGKENPVGKQIKIFNKWNLVVSGVIKDFPSNSSIDAGILVNAENNNFKFYFSCENSSDSSSYRYLFNIFLQLKQNVQPQQFIPKFTYNAGIFAPYEKKVSLIPLKDIYLYDNTIGSCNKKGNPGLLSLLQTIALIILLLAVINYINLTAAQQNKRNKETGIRKTIGASRSNIVFHFLSESVLITLAAFLTAVVIVDISLPVFGSLLDMHLSLLSLIKYPVYIIVTLSVLLVGILAGSGPALIFSSFSPAKIFRGDVFKSRMRGNLRNLLTVFQFTISSALIICLIIIQKQINYVKHANLGFNKEQLVRFDIPSGNSKLNVLENKFRDYSGIKSFCPTFGVPGKINMHMGSNIKGKDKSISIIIADSSFINTFGVKLVKGRMPKREDIGTACLINETAYKYFGWDNLKNKVYNNGRKGGFKVIGIVKDFNVASMHSTIEPLAILFSRDYSSLNISVRIVKGRIGSTMKYIQKVWHDVYPEYPFKYQFYDEWIDSIYRKDERFGQTIALFAFLAITISCLGILGLAVFMTETRRKEIGIRKVHGAGVNGIMFLLNKDFIKLIFISFIIACPVAWFVAGKWLQDFAYRTKINWWVFAVSFIVLLFIALSTVSWHAYKAATANPVKSLRYE